MAAKKNKDVSSDFGMHRLFGNSGMHRLFDGSPFTSLFEKSSSRDSEADPKSTAKDVADWMLETVMKGTLYQRDAVEYIERHFGQRFIYSNENDNPAISTKVLDEFRHVSKDTVVWNRRERYWRLWQPGDPRSRMVDD